MITLKFKKDKVYGFVSERKIPVKPYYSLCQYTSSDMFNETKIDMVLCKSGIRRWFDIPKDVENFTLKFTKNSISSESFNAKIEVGYHTSYVKLDNRRCRATLSYTALAWLQEELGNEFYITLEYKE